MPVIDPQAVRDGDRRAISRALSAVENNSSRGRELLEALFPFTGRAHLIGITGAPGTGKSTLVNQLALSFRKESTGESSPRVGIIAVDPTSPFSGGALLGDRVRMQDLAGDSGIFIRSMASRGSLGGLAATTSGLAQVFDAAGYEIILIETVGAGQAEVDIARLAHSTVVIEAPGLGDEIQTIKAGILEIADLLVVNKADHPGAEHTIRALRGMLALAHPGQEQFDHHGQQMDIDPPPDQDPNKGWIPPLLATTATTGEGIDELRQQLAAHRAYLVSSGEWKVRDHNRLASILEKLLAAALRQRWESQIPPAMLQDHLERVNNREISPWKAVELLIEGADL